jgi:hypothetical protein
VSFRSVAPHALQALCLTLRTEQPSEVTTFRLAPIAVSLSSVRVLAVVVCDTAVSRTVFCRLLVWETVQSQEVGRDSSVGIATRYGQDGPGFETRGVVIFSAPVQTGPGAHPASCTMGTGSVPEVKRPGCGVDHPPHLAPRLKKE